VLTLKHTESEDQRRVARALEDDIRAWIANTLPNAHVVTREETEVFIARDPLLTDCAEDCQFDAAKRVGADLVVTGELSMADGVYRLALRLHEVADHRLLPGAGKAVGSTLPMLEEGANVLVRQVLGGVPTRYLPRYHGPLSKGALIGGGVGAAVGGVFVLRMMTSASDWNAARTTAAWTDARNRTNESAAAATVSLSIAGALLAAGVSLWLLTDY
jgi:hypothetical protein